MTKELRIQYWNNLIIDFKLLANYILFSSYAVIKTLSNSYTAKISPDEAAFKKATIHKRPF